MQHLPTDRLAALADEPPTTAERAHLDGCVECSRERAAHERLLAMAREVPADAGRLAMPLTRWSALGEALRAEGLVRDEGTLGIGAPSSHGRRGDALRRARPLIFRIAAALLLVVGGTALGRLSAGTSPFPTGAPVAASDVAPQPGERARAVPASLTIDSLLPAFSSVEEARLAQARYETAFQHAAAYIAAHEAGSPDAAAEDHEAVQARLTALDGTVQAMRRAMRVAPADPVINGYYLTSLGHREATIRALGAALPAAERLSTF
jgi:hypothetical protein